MFEFFANFHFIRPWFLLLLLVPIIFYWTLAKGRSSRSSWEDVCDKNLLDFLVVRGSSKQRKLLQYLAFFGIFFAILALCGPTWSKKNVPTFAPNNPVMIVLDLSSDMYEKDITPNRLDRAKYKISDLLKMLKSAQVGLIVYSSEPYLISPITDDLKLVENLLPALDLNIMPENGSRLDRAIDMAIEKLKNSGFGDGNIVVVASDVGQKFDGALEKADYASNLGFRMSVVNINSAMSEKLQMVAKHGGGVYADVSFDDKDVSILVNEINKNISDDLKVSENMREQWNDFGAYLVLLPILCCLYFFRKGVLVTLLLIAFASNAQAGFFLNANQSGLKDFEEGRFREAAEEFDDAAWKAASYYRLGDFEKSLAGFSKKNDTEGLYNQGNALAKGGKIEEAIKKYEQVLGIEPEHDDAKFNLEYLKQQQQQNQQNQGGRGEDSEDKKQEQEQKEQPSEGDKQQAQENSSGEEDSGESKQNLPNEGDNEEKSGSSEGEALAQQEDNQNKEKQDMKAASGEAVEDSEEFDEEAQARELQYREVPEDPGGLLRAFILREYNKKRYEEK